MRAAAARTADQPGRPGVPARHLPAGDHGRLGARRRRAAMAGPARPSKHAGPPGAPPQPPVTQIKRFLRRGAGRQTACGARTASGVRTVSAVHQAPRAGKFPGTAGVWSSTTTTSLTEATHCGLAYYHLWVPKTYAIRRYS
jgi:hypothetical protein